MKSNKKLLTGIIIAAVSCVLVALITVSILLSGKINFNGGVEDNSVSAGYVSPDSNSSTNADIPPSMLTPYWCAYRFEANVYETNAVNGKVSYAIDDNVFEMCYNGLLGYCDAFESEIVEYDIYLVIYNTEVASDLISSRYHREPAYAQQLKEYEPGTVQNGVYVHKKFEFKDLNSFPFDKYSISVYRDEKKQIVRNFAHTEEINIPEQLFADDIGCIEIALEECVTYDNGRVTYNMNSDVTDFYYLKEGNQIKISRTEFK